MKNLKKALLMVLVLLLTITFLPNNLNEVQAAKAKLNKTKITVQKGNNYTLQLQNNTDAIKWTSSNKKIATVSSDGVVTGKKIGSCKVYAKVGSKKYTCNVTVKDDLKYFNYDEIILTKGNTFTQYFVYNHRFVWSGVKWSSSNKNIATVNSKGEITGKNAGNVTIIAKYKNKNYNFDMYVIDEKVLYEDEYVKVKINSFYSMLADKYWGSGASDNANFTIQNKNDISTRFSPETLGINGVEVYSGNEYKVISGQTSIDYNIDLNKSVKLYDIKTLSGYMYSFGVDNYTKSSIDFSNVKILE